MQPPELLRSGEAARGDVAPLVDPGIQRKAQLLRGPGHELPQAGRLGGGHRSRLEAVLRGHEPHQAKRQSRLPQHTLELVPVAPRPAVEVLEGAPTTWILGEEAEEPLGAPGDRHRQLRGRQIREALGLHHRVEAARLQEVGGELAVEGAPVLGLARAQRRLGGWLAETLGGVGRSEGAGGGDERAAMLGHADGGRRQRQEAEQGFAPSSHARADTVPKRARGR